MSSQGPAASARTEKQVIFCGELRRNLARLCSGVEQRVTYIVQGELDSRGD
jgi:hypothetical protein